MAAEQKIDEQILQAICNVIGDTSQGLTGSEMGKLFRECNIPDPSPSMTKRYRLFDALNLKQKQDRCSNNILAFIVRAMNPINFINAKELFENQRNDLNKTLSFIGLHFTEEGQIKIVQKAKTISDAEARASQLKKDLIDRNIHPDVLKFCKAELLTDNYFHAVFEASKSIADKIRDKTKLTSDGSKLVTDALSIGQKEYPLLAFNALQTESEKSEHNGIVNLLIGLFGTFRNTTAHVPKIKWNIERQDALDMLTLASLLHRKLDNSVLTKVL